MLHCNMWKCCMRNNQISAQDEEESNEVEKIKTTSSSIRVWQKDNTSGKGSQSNCISGPVRIRLVVTKKELKRMLSNKNETDEQAQYTSLEKLLRDMKLKEKRVYEIEENGGGIVNSWRPALESIPEDCSMK